MTTKWTAEKPMMAQDIVDPEMMLSRIVDISGDTIGYAIVDEYAPVAPLITAAPEMLDALRDLEFGAREYVDNADIFARDALAWMAAQAVRIRALLARIEGA